MLSGLWPRSSYYRSTILARTRYSRRDSCRSPPYITGTRLSLLISYPIFYYLVLLPLFPLFLSFVILFLKIHASSSGAGANENWLSFEPTRRCRPVDAADVVNAELSSRETAIDPRRARKNTHESRKLSALRQIFRFSSPLLYILPSFLPSFSLPSFLSSSFLPSFLPYFFLLSSLFP